jgi:hypothetical protein
MSEGRQIPPAMSTIPLGMAGAALSLQTDSPRLAELAAEFFSPVGVHVSHTPRATLTMVVNKRRETPDVGENFPIFRGRKEYVHADYGRDGSLWFDLKARAVSGMVSHDLLADAPRFRSAVLAVIAGVLAPALGLTGVHAGCVVRDGKAALLAATSGVGKSTLALALALRGWSLLSDDWTFVSASPIGLHAWGMRTSLKLLPDAVGHFPELSALSPKLSLNGEMSFEVDPWSFFHIDRAVQATPAAVILLERNASSREVTQCKLERCAPDETRRRLFSDIEEQPAEIDRVNESQSSLIDQLCTLPSYKMQICGHPAAIAAELNPILTEQLCG